MDQDLQAEETTRDLQLSRWQVPVLAAVLTVNLCLVAVAVGRPTGQPAIRAGAAAPVSVPVVARTLPQVVSLPAPTSPLPNVPPAPVEQVPEEPAPIQRVTIVPDVDLVVPPEMPPAETVPADPAPTPSPVETPVVTSPPPEPQPIPRNELPALVIVNPPQSGGLIHYGVDGEIFTLLPGEYHRLTGADRRRVEFHQGDDFDYCQHDLAEGVHQFSIGPAGWMLQIVEPEKSARLIETCRPLLP